MSLQTEKRPWRVGGAKDSRAGGLLSAGSHRAVLLRRTRLRLARYIPNFPDGKLRDLLSHKIEGRPWCVGGVIGSRAGGLLSAGSRRAVLLHRTRLRLAKYVPNFPDGKLRDLLSHKTEGRHWCVGGAKGSRAGGCSRPGAVEQSCFAGRGFASPSTSRISPMGNYGTFCPFRRRKGPGVREER
ncbi:hypothetical protein GCWU000341_00581 [Oribacterium sp. oral taxon 078 str. F0262]|nr:hypothetical protein GCWU000341_00581 [Oribacterium sp. oral taxon 078 str. F0262]